MALASLLPLVYAGAMLLMGGLALGLWMRQRDALYGCFGLAALLGCVRPLAAALGSGPAQGDLAAGLLALAYGGQLGLMARFVLLATGADPGWLLRACDATLAAVLGLAVVSFSVGWPGLWTSALALLLLLGLACFWFVQREARRQRRLAVWAVLMAGSLLIAAGLHDLGMVRTHTLGVAAVALAPHAMFLLVVVLAGIVVERYTASVREVRALNADLARRVAERESQLHEAFETLRVQREEQAALQERQRIMRDIHDGVGAQLVGLLSLVGRQRPDPKLVEQHVMAALDELRMAVDSMQPVHGDLATVLATLRYRLQPRLQASGLQVLWAVESLPLLADLPPSAVLQVQRILLEAFTNVIRHAAARTVTVAARCVEEPGHRHLLLEVADDGVGLPDGPAPAGHGLRNMHTRAAAIGARLRVEPASPRGTRMRLEWPLEPAEPGARPPLA